MPDKFKAFYLPVFRRDIQAAVAWSQEHFGDLAAKRYAGLIAQALHDLLEDPKRAGAMTRLDLAPSATVYHLAFSRERVAGERVKSPRHFVLFRQIDDRIEFARLVHDSRDLVRHMPAAFRSE